MSTRTKPRIGIKDLPEETKLTAKQLMHIVGGAVPSRISFEDPLTAFEDPLTAFEDPLTAFEDPLTAIRFRPLTRG